MYFNWTWDRCFIHDIDSKSIWDLVYKKAINSDGSLLFPERLTREFLENARRTQGSYIFANQYMNEVIPDDAKVFKQEWLKYYDTLPEGAISFAFIDPAIGQKAHNDYTAIVVVYVDYDGNYYLHLANRYRLTPSQIVNKVFEIKEVFKCEAIGIESVAYQEALIYLTSEEMGKRNKVIPLKDIKRSSVSKETRILALVPRFEWNKLYIRRGLTDFEDEYAHFPRSSHDDIMDALATIEEIARKPEKKKVTLEKPHSPHDPSYEKYIIQQLQNRANEEQYE